VQQQRVAAEVQQRQVAEGVHRQRQVAEGVHRQRGP
jgi:hypothetical protein